MPASPDSSTTWPSEAAARRQRLSSSSTSSLRPTSGAVERARSALKRLSEEPRAADLEDLERRADTAQLAFAQTSVAERAAGQARRQLRHDHAVGRCLGLQAGGDVGRVAGNAAVATFHAIADRHQPGGHADPHRQRLALVRRQSRDLLDQFEADRDGALGIVLAHGRPAEQGHDPVAEQARHVATHLAHGLAGRRMVAVDDRRQLLGIEARGKFGRADQVAEQHGHLAPFGLAAALKGVEADDEIVDARPLQRRDGVEQPLAMAERRHAERQQVGVGEVGDDIEVDRVRREGRGVLGEPQCFEPRVDVCRHAPVHERQGRGRPPT